MAEDIKVKSDTAIATENTIDLISINDLAILRNSVLEEINALASKDKSKNPSEYLKQSKTFNTVFKSVPVTWDQAPTTPFSVYNVVHAQLLNRLNNCVDTLQQGYNNIPLGIKESITGLHTGKLASTGTGSVISGVTPKVPIVFKLDDGSIQFGESERLNGVVDTSSGIITVSNLEIPVVLCDNNSKGSPTVFIVQSSNGQAASEPIKAVITFSSLSLVPAAVNRISTNQLELRNITLDIKSPVYLNFITASIPKYNFNVLLERNYYLTLTDKNYQVSGGGYTHTYHIVFDVTKLLPVNILEATLKEISKTGISQLRVSLDSVITDDDSTLSISTKYQGTVSSVNKYRLITKIFKDQALKIQPITFPVTSESGGRVDTRPTDSNLVYNMTFELNTNFKIFIGSIIALYKFLNKTTGDSKVALLNKLFGSPSGRISSFNKDSMNINIELPAPSVPEVPKVLNANSAYSFSTNDINIKAEYESFLRGDKKLTELASGKYIILKYLYDEVFWPAYTIFMQFKPAGILQVSNSQITIINGFSLNSFLSELKAQDLKATSEAVQTITETPEVLADIKAKQEASDLADPEAAEKKKQKLKEDAEKQEYLTNARNKVDTLQYGTIMQNPASTFSSRMEDIGVQASVDANKMEANEYGGLGTNWINEKIDSPASLRIYSESKGPEDQPKTLESIYVDCFLLQGVQEVDEEKYSIFQSLNGDTLVQFFGRRPTTLNLSGILYDTKNQQWYNDFKYWYDNYLRGSAALKNDSRIVLVYTDQIIEGFILSMSMQKQATTNTSVTVNFTMLVVSHTPLATEWTDPLHSEIPRGFHSKEADKRNQDIIDKNKDFMSSLDTLNFELLADASPDKDNYYDNYLKSNTKLGAALEYSSGSSLSSIAFSSKLADVKLNMGVSEVSSDVIATANSNQNAGLALGSSGISMDSLKLKLNNAEDYARSYRTSQEKSTMDQINFRLSKS